MRYLPLICQCTIHSVWSQCWPGTDDSDKSSLEEAGQREKQMTVNKKGQLFQELVFWLIVWVRTGSRLPKSQMDKRLPFSQNHPLHQVAGFFMCGLALWSSSFAVQVNLDHSLQIFSSHLSLSAVFVLPLHCTVPFFGIFNVFQLPAAKLRAIWERT